MAINSIPSLNNDTISFRRVSFEERRRRHRISFVIFNILTCIICISLFAALTLIILNLTWLFSNVNNINPQEQVIIHENCNKPFKTGPCRGIYIRYYYDTTLHNCSEFIYGGCGGNTNKFITYHDCMDKCIEKVYI